MLIHAEVCDLLQDEDGGWRANGCWSRSVDLEVPDDASDALIARRVKKALNIQGLRADPWCSADYSWRELGVGAWAYVVT